MSFDLVVWETASAVRPAEAQTIYERLMDEGPPEDWKKSEKVSAFGFELAKNYPPPDSFSDDDIDDCVWSEFDLSEAKWGTHISLCISWDHAKIVAPYVIQLARQHGLLCYDPQEEVVHLPPGVR